MLNRLTKDGVIPEESRGVERGENRELISGKIYRGGKRRNLADLNFLVLNGGVCSIIEMYRVCDFWGEACCH